MTKMQPMTTETNAATNAGAERENMSWGATAMSFAGELAGERFDRGELAALRRMDPNDPPPTAIRLMARRGLLGSPDVEEKWALILHGIAIMTRTSGTTPQDRTAHDGSHSKRVGRALFYGDNPERSEAFYSESRFNRLMSARGAMFRTLLVRMFRMVAAANQPFDWQQMAELILYDEFEGYAATAKRIRQSIAGDYYQAEAAAAPKSE